MIKNEMREEAMNENIIILSFDIGLLPLVAQMYKTLYGM